MNSKEEEKLNLNGSLSPRIIIIGDVHGCLTELKELLIKTEFQQGKDRLIFVGDLVGKGPNSVEVVHFVKNELRAESVKGNHDERLVEYFISKQKGEVPRPFSDNTHTEAAKQMTDEDFNWLASLPLYISIPEYKTIIVHAGIAPGKPISQHSPKELYTMRNILEDGSPSPMATSGKPWASLWNGPEHVIFGHDAKRGLQRYEYATGLDTGCCYGKQLTAFILPSKEIVQVQAHQIYSIPEGGVL